jgi:hypothetical protein
MRKDDATKRNTRIVPGCLAQVLARPSAHAQAQTAAVLKGVWIVTVLVWPILKWMISLDCALQLVRMIYHWETPGVYAGWDFLLHFAALAALACLLCFALQAKSI